MSGTNNQPPQFGHGAPPQGYPQQQPTFGQPGWQQEQPKGSNRGLMILGIVLSSVGLLLGVFVLLWMLGVIGPGNSTSADEPTTTPAAEPSQPVETTEPEPEPTKEPTPEPTNVSDADLDLSPRTASDFTDTTVDWKFGSAESFAAREQFFKDQKVTPNNTKLSAVTVPQRTFIARQRAFMESKGGTWNSDIENFYLAISLNACETSILNGHNVTSTVYDGYFLSSPMISAVLKNATDDEKKAAMRNFEAITIFGVSYICPGDTNDWAAVYKEKYGESANYF